MRDTQNVTIAALLVTGAILTVLLIGIHSDKAAHADASVKGAGYIMVAGQVSSDMDYVYVIDIAARMLNVYGYDPGTDAIEMGEPVDLTRLFGD
jgi:hypothetical protein